LLSSACSDSSNKQYTTYLKKWLCFCKVKNILVSKPDLNDVLEFLSGLFEEGLGYSAINTARSALSLILDPIEGFAVGKHPTIVRLLKGIANSRPPHARYETIWDAGVVLTLFKSWGKNSQLSLKNLTLKLVGLLALTTAQRVQTLSKIRLSNVKGSETKVILIDSRLKTTNVLKPLLTLTLSPFKQNPNLCVLNCLNEYLQRTAALRNNEDQLLISYSSPHLAICSQTISRWLKSLLEQANVDVSVYKAHSFRHASTSKASLNGVDVNVIFSKAGWAKGSTMFAKFYNRPIDNSYKFMESVLKS